MEYDKRFAVFSDVNEGDFDDPSAQIVDNLIHESGRLQLNAYQAFVENLMNPMSDLRALLLVHGTGTGKTITALATATEYVRLYQPMNEQSSVSSIMVLGFTKDIFAKELLTHPEFSIVNIDEAEELKQLEQQLDGPAQFEMYQIKRSQYMRRLAKREVKGIYQFFGYRKFANRIINMEDIQKMIRNRYAEAKDNDVSDLDPMLVKKWVDAGDVRINTSFIASLSRSLFICDEVHNLYKNDSLNTYGLAIKLVFDYFFTTLPANDGNYRGARALLLSATPLTSSPLEIIPIVSLLSGEVLSHKEMFKVSNGVEQITSVGTSKIRQAIAGRISYVMDDNPSEYPSSSFVGEPIANIDFLRFVRSQPIDHQLACIQNWSDSSNRIDLVDATDDRTNRTGERGITLIKDIALPATSEHPHGVVFSRNVTDLADLPPDVAVHRSSSGRYTSNIFQRDQLIKYSCKYACLVDLCLKMKSSAHGKMFVYHPFVQGSGTDLIVSILQSNGFVMDGEHPSSDSVCMHCDYLLEKHSKEHEFTPVRFVVITGSVSKTAIANRLSVYNSDANALGERIKLVIGSRAMRESHTLKACRHVVIAHAPSSISELIQIIGRSVRKHAHELLPPAMRSVSIHVLTTNVDLIPKASNDIASNEELAYKMKVLFYKQIHIIERIMYDVAIDYLIHFRLKLKETPPLLGEASSLDFEAYNKYENTLSKAYDDVRNGVTPYGIHTNRFNVFYFEGEVRITMIIIKRILLSHQPAMTLYQLRGVVRSPPFRVEYNTQLISDEAISVAVNKLAFREEQLRIVATTKAASHFKVTDALYDQTSLLIDQNGREYNIVCIGDPMCLDSMLIRRLTSSIAQGDACMVDAFRNLQIPSMNQPIDLKAVALTWDSTIDLNDVINTIRRKIEKSNVDKINFKEKDTLLKLPLSTHCMLAEWGIKRAADRAINRAAHTESDIQVTLYILKYYQLKRLTFTIHQLKYTRVYDRYKKYDVDTGATWASASARPSLASLPIGHAIGSAVRIYQPADKTWLELSTIGKGVQSSHPYSFYIYEDRLSPNSLSVVLKIRFTNDPKAKGITMAFLQLPKLLKVGKAIGLNLTPSMHKTEVINMIEEESWNIQTKLFPKRVIYRLNEL